MPFTNITIIRKHLAELRKTLRTVEDFYLHLDGTEEHDLPHKNIKLESEKVKGREKNSPELQSVVIGNDPVALNHTNLIPQSIVVASDESLGMIYKENVDFHAEYKDGTISRIATGAIPADSEVAVWYYYYRIYNRNTDYAMIYSSGKIIRLTEGAIEDGQALWIDYEVEAGSFGDDMLTQALEEANAILRGEIADEFLESDDSRLTVAETYLALAVLARMKTLELLQSQYIDAREKSGIADDYLRLGKSYSDQAEYLLRDFRKNAGSLSFPVKIRN